MAGRAYVGIVGVAGVAALVTWFGIVKREPVTEPAPVTQLAEPPAAARPQPGMAASKPAEPVVSPAPKASEPGKAAGAAPVSAPTPAPAQPKPQLQAASEPGQAPAAVAEPTPAQAEPASSVAAPTFDIVRVEPSGDTVIAGQGVPGATVELLRNGEPYAHSVADVGGQWAIVPAPLAKGAAELTLRVTTPDGRVALSDQAVTVRVPEQPGEKVVVVLNAPNTPSKVLSAGAGTAEEKSAEPKVAAARPAPAGSRANARIKTVEADESGRFFVTGSAHPGANIRIYLNRSLIANVKAAEDGAFGLTIEKGMAPGSYSVRVDDFDAASGKVLTRAEVPFVMEARASQPAPAAVVTAQAGPPKVLGNRDVANLAPRTASAPADAPAEPAQAAPAPPADEAPSTSVAGVAGAVKPATPAASAPALSPSVAVVPEIKTVTIVRGDNLWRIAKKTYGRGTRYTVIYDANSEQIRDANLIYPDQIFVMPKAQPE
jgi:nucleoid-associated protein YgaU